MAAVATRQTTSMPHLRRPGVCDRGRSSSCSAAFMTGALLVPIALTSCTDGEGPDGSL